MATSFGTAIPTIVVYRVHRIGRHAVVRVHIGEAAGGMPCGALTLRPSEFRAWRATLRDDPSRCSVWYHDGVFEWLHSGAAAEAEAVSS